MMLFFFLFADQWDLQPKINLFDDNGKLGEGSDKSVQCFVVMEIRWKPHCQVVATHGGQTFRLLLVTSH